ncbi:FG-GAP-like repeat-containing protein [Oxynema aestuarii]|uniref:VCBS repeat-containing protein n=1 Tax=Oxynema aestuarii AP17 TaxID=2064643 RepID=A0A6H1TTH6_9CYAN|nr:FG-GAP-like repeat-containing protein [Oxynema aestuarii]QIZ69745.1 hypothetical protein HCG48_03420 [Oxynema aestuarii AP17]
MGSSTEQTASVVFDFDRNGVNDFAIAARSRGPSIVGYRRSATGWDAYAIEPETLAIEAGGVDYDIDGDGDRDLDVVVGEHQLEHPETAKVYWFENRDGVGLQWKSHLVAVGDEHHDGTQAIDLDRDGDLDLISIGWGHDRVLIYENIRVSGDLHASPEP